MKDVVLILQFKKAMRLITDNNNCDDEYECMTRRWM
jgi:hypothetical protein